MKTHLTHVIYTDIGGREINEDSVGVFEKEDKHCYVLCDGLGGHGMGDVASSMTVSIFKDIFEKSDGMVNFLGKAFMASQEILMAEQTARNARQKMKTTSVVLATDAKKAYIGHIGDSRLYIFSGNQVKKRTLDHSIPQMLVLSHELEESQIRNHPDRNTLLRVLGVEWDKPMYELMSPIPLRKCQAFLLCSDGFWELIDESDMCAMLKKASSVGEWMDMMTMKVKVNGIGKNMDNNSAIAIWNQ